MGCGGSWLTVVCPECGFESPDPTRYCTNCGTALAVGAPPVALDSRKGIERTRTGFLLLAVGFILGVIPFVDIVGLLLSIVAVVLILLGAAAFGEAHRRAVIWSLVLYLVVFGATAVAFAAVLFPYILAIVEGSQVDLSATLLPTVLIVAGSGAAQGIPYLLIGYRLLDERTRPLAWVILIVHVGAAVGLGVYLFVTSQTLLDLSLPGTVQGVYALDPVRFLLSLTNLLWAALYYRVHRRVAKGALGATPPA